MLKNVLVEDNNLLRETMEEFLLAEGHSVRAFPSAEAAAGAWEEAQVVVLDLNLPGENGISVARRLRAARGDLGIVMLTARTDPAQRQQGYESGADIYLTKPSSPGELSAALRSLARRLVPGSAGGPELRVDRTGLMVQGPLGSVRLSAAEMDLLLLFADSPEGRVPFARMSELGGLPASRGAVDVRVTRLRKKLASVTGGTNPVAAVRNYGYQLTLRIVEQGGPRGGAGQP